LGGRTLREYAQTNLFESKPLGYLEIYENYFSDLQDKKIKLLELGVAKGLSMLMWRDYFINGTISGVDLFPGEIDDPRIHIYTGRQNDITLLSRIASERAPDGFDIIVDDAAHIGELAKISFWHLFNNHLKSGGIYAIEDWGTGYWGRHVYYPDGNFYKLRDDETLLHWLANKMLKLTPVEWPHLGPLQRLLRRHQFTRKFRGHDYGMVGFVRQLVDECGMAERTNPEQGVAHPPTPPEPVIPSRFRSMMITPGVVMIVKA
jgi:hypothetical protein